MGTQLHSRCLITSGIAVREFREGRGDRTRTVYAMVWGKAKTANETFVFLQWLVVSFLVLGIDVRMFKSDIRKAFRFCF